MLQRRFRPFDRGRAFTLVELLVVMAIIALLAAITLIAAQAVMSAGARSRARTEITAMSSGLESYKSDNGIYPANVMAQPYPNDPTTLVFELGAQTLYQALSGQTNYSTANITPPRSYMTFKVNQLGNYKAGSAPTYVADPYGFAYGYSTGDGTPANVPYSGAGFFDLWSTGGQTAVNTQAGQSTTNSWIVNWK